MNEAITSLRQRMIEDMRMRKLAPKTQSACLLQVRRLAACLGRAPDTVSGEDLRLFQLHLVETGCLFRTHGPAWRQANHAHLRLGQLKVMSPRTLPAEASDCLRRSRGER
jgi:hypothetical protein